MMVDTWAWDILVIAVAVIGFAFAALLIKVTYEIGR
jgi:hypothetical protein